MAYSNQPFGTSVYLKKKVLDFVTNNFKMPTIIVKIEVMFISIRLWIQFFLEHNGVQFVSLILTKMGDFSEVYRINYDILIVNFQFAAITNPSLRRFVLNCLNIIVCLYSHFKEQANRVFSEKYPQQRFVGERKHWTLQPFLSRPNSLIESYYNIHKNKFIHFTTQKGILEFSFEISQILFIQFPIDVYISHLLAFSQIME